MKTQKFYSLLLIHNYKKISLLCCLWLLIFSAYAQHVTITPNGITPATSSSYPRLSYDALITLPNPTVGDIAYDLTFKCLRVFNGTNWNAVLQQPNSTGYNAEMAILTSSGGPSHEIVNDVALDKNGNVYMTGYFGGTINFGSTSITSQGGYDVFIVKYNKNGVAQWAQTAGGTNNDYATSIAVDDSSNVYIGGNFKETINFGSNSGSSIGLEDIFVAKYNAAGVNQWARSFGSINSEDSYGIAVDKNSNVYITGRFFETIIFFNTVLVSKGSTDIFFVKYNSSGVLQWAKAEGGTSFDSGIAIATDKDENVFLTGSFYANMTIGSTNLFSYGADEIFIVKYNKDGVPQWAKSAGSSQSDIVTDILVDNMNSIVITGYSEGTCNFGSHSITNQGEEDIFIAKYVNANGNATWAKSIGGVKDERATAICADNESNIYLTGYFTGAVNVDNTVIKPIGNKDMLIVKLDIYGEIKWSKSVGGLPSVNGTGIAADNDNNIYAVGNFQNKVTDGNTTKTALGGVDYVLLRLIN